MPLVGSEANEDFAGGGAKGNDGLLLIPILVPSLRKIGSWSLSVGDEVIRRGEYILFLRQGDDVRMLRMAGILRQCGRSGKNIEREESAFHAGSPVNRHDSSQPWLQFVIPAIVKSMPRAKNLLCRA